ncbi:MAG: phycobilisome linker polypeptide, partial [Aphanizomenon sp.]
DKMQQIHKVGGKIVSVIST